MSKLGLRIVADVLKNERAWWFKAVDHSDSPVLAAQKFLLHQRPGRLNTHEVQHVSRGGVDS